MKNLLAITAVLGALATTMPASAASWESINARQARLDERIDMGIRNGSLTRGEAIQLRGEFNDIARLEARYRSDGLSVRERADLDRRFDALSARINYQRHDAQNRGDGRWMSINDRQARLDQRIDAGIRDGSLTRREAYSLRAQFRGIARLEASYRRNGLSGWERRDLDRRFDRLSATIEAERNDSQHGYRG